MFARLQGAREVERCHVLHYLQMATEKLAKAYRVRDTSAPLEGDGGLLRRHVGLVKFIRALLLSPKMQEAYAWRSSQLASFSKTAAALEGEIEKLAPAVDQATTPENTEYPWLADDSVVVPCEYTYPQLSLFEQPGGRGFIKLLRRAVEDFESIHIG
jgi:hypothetical protein